MPKSSTLRANSKVRFERLQRLRAMGAPAWVTKFEQAAMAHNRKGKSTWDRKRQCLAAEFDTSKPHALLEAKIAAEAL